MTVRILRLCVLYHIKKRRKYENMVVCENFLVGGIKKFPFNWSALIVFIAHNESGNFYIPDNLCLNCTESLQ